MSLQEFLIEKFESWKPPEPEVMNRTKRDITLNWSQLEPFDFLAGDFIYKIEKYNKMPRWIVVYSGGKTTKTIDNLAPRHPHRFRLRVILKAEAVPRLADRAIHFYGDETAVYEKFGKTDETNKTAFEDDNIQTSAVVNESGGDIPNATIPANSGRDAIIKSSDKCEKRKWVESRWSEETWTSTDSDGTSAVCFSMAVRCGYTKQVQSMLEERPDLIGAINPQNGFTPLATAVRRGDMNMVRYLISMGADVEQPSAAGQTPLHLALYAANTHMAELLLDKGASLQACDWNGLRAEHYAVDSRDLDTVRFVLQRGGDLAAEDNNGWTPLFRAVCQGAETALVAELAARGGADATDRAGLPLACVARMLTDPQGRRRESILRLVDSNYPHEKALANFTRLTKKIYNVHSLLKLI
ncbi:ankyrin-3 [Manduca sexta]|uniref:ankyrin-3 n=1 Tax=Manduca sexta TaxID=7130 RepID=UPI00188E0524|nr:ankyrin-3 [Manduca sexta]